MPANLALTGKRLCRLGYAARYAKIGRGLQSFGAKPPFSRYAFVGQLCFIVVDYFKGEDMAIKEFELFHGAVLVKMLRSDRPINIKMIETRPDDAWGVYTINDEIELFIKQSTSPRPLSRGKGGYSWTFTFSPEHISQLEQLQTKRQIYVALVCARKTIKRGQRMEICFLKPDEFSQVIDMVAKETQSVTVRYVNGAKKFRVFLNRQEKLLISLNEIDRWIAPGS